MADPLVSICMPLYNTERFVGDAIRGVLNQTYRNFELIVCDNGSTDRSVAIVEEFAAKDPRIRLCRNRRNLGYAGNLHKVTSLALGEFMIVHCADDLAEPGAIETMVRLATQPGVDRDNVVVLSDTFVAEAEGRRIGVHRQRPGGFDLMHQELDEYRSDGSVERFRGRTALKYALPRLAIVGWLGATFYSRRLFESIEGVYNGLLYTPDLQLNYHLMSRDPEVLWIREPLFSWRLHESGHIGKARAEAVPSHAWDGYTYTFHFPPRLLEELGVSKADIVEAFIDSLCLRKALSEIRSGSMVLAFRHICLSLATYPGTALRNPKFYAAVVGVLAGPFGRLASRAGYALGIWRGRPLRMPAAR